MGNIRPITDTWILARPKLKAGRKWYGAYPAGFPERGRALLGASLESSVLHVCGGMARFYAYSRGFGPNDKTLDLDPATEPDFLCDVRKPWPTREKWRFILADPAYSKTDQAKYKVGVSAYPKPIEIQRQADLHLEVGGRFGILHYDWIRPLPNWRNVALITIYMGYGNSGRTFSVHEKVSESENRL
jgi:hypothetical protein